MLRIVLICSIAYCVAGAPTSPPPPPASGGTTPVFRDECKDHSLNDCPVDSTCVDQFYGYSCQCKPGFVDKSPEKENPGRVCVPTAAEAAGTPVAAVEEGAASAPEASSPSPVTKKPHRKTTTTGKTEPSKEDVTKSPLDELAKDSATPTEKPKTHRKSKTHRNSTKPKEDGEQQPPSASSPTPVVDNESSKAALRDTFNFFDTSADGQINLSELRAATKALNQKLETEDLKRMLEAADKNSDGVVSFSEFQTLMKARRASSSSSN